MWTAHHGVVLLAHKTTQKDPLRYMRSFRARRPFVHCQKKYSSASETNFEMPQRLSIRTEVAQ